MINKSSATNLIALLGLAVGWLQQIDWLITMSLFALSGALTNWLAVHMLFEKVPGLYGSGIIQLKFDQFKTGIKALIMDQFFTSENINRFMSEQTGEAHHFDIAPIIEDTNLSPAFDSLVDTVKQSSFGGMLSMFGGEKALESMREPFVTKLRIAIIDISNTDEFAEKLKAKMSSSQNVDAMMEKVDSIVTSRLDELTPQMVKNIIQDMIKTHLGWLVVWGGVFGGAIGLASHFIV